MSLTVSHILNYNNFFRYSSIWLLQFACADTILHHTLTLTQCNNFCMYIFFETCFYWFLSLYHSPCMVYQSSAFLTTFILLHCGRYCHTYNLFVKLSLGLILIVLYHSLLFSDITNIYTVLLLFLLYNFPIISPPVLLVLEVFYVWIHLMIIFNIRC